MFKSPEELTRLIDHTNLKATATFSDIVNLVDEAERFGFYGVCINPIYVPVVKELRKDSDFKIVSVVGFPLGATGVEVKISEGEYAVRNGADELDIVSNIGFLKSKRYDLFQDDVETIIQHFRRRYPGIILKIIVDIPYLDEEEVRTAVKIINYVKPDFIKTSTGYAPRGTSVDDVTTVRSLLSRDIKIKAAGGIRTLKQVAELVKAGADRIGTSTGVNIAKEAMSKVQK